MATYRTIASTETDPQAPITASLMKALEANPTAISEGATGAPRVLSKALAQTFLDFQSVSSTTPAEWLNLDGMETIRLDIGISTWNNAATLQVRFSNNNGSSWGSYQSLVTNGTGASAFGSVTAQVNLRTGEVSAFAAVNPVQANAATLTVPANCNALQLRISVGASTEIRALAWCFGGLEA